MMFSRQARILVLLILLVGLTQIVYSIGVGPPSNKLFFEPGFSDRYQIKILGAKKDLEVSASVSGDLSKYITLEKNELTVPPSGARLSYEINLPQGLEPGRHTSRITIQEKPKGDAGSGVHVLSAVIHKIIVNVPYQDKYAAAEIEVHDTKIGKPAYFTITVTNYGNKVIYLTKGTITIYDSEDKKITTLETDTKGLNQKSSVCLHAQWTPKDVKPGAYTAKATVNYDEKQTKTETIFKIGDLFIDINDLNPKEIEKDKINKINIEIQSYWGLPIENVYAHINLLKSQEKIGKQQTPSINLKKWKKTNITAYIDTTNYVLGTYTANIILNYGGKNTTKDFSLVVKEPESKLEMIVILITIGVLLIILITIVVYLVRRSLNKI